MITFPDVNPIVTYAVGGVSLMVLGFAVPQILKRVYRLSNQVATAIAGGLALYFGTLPVFMLPPETPKPMRMFLWGVLVAFLFVGFTMTHAFAGKLFEQAGGGDGNGNGGKPPQ